MNMKTLNFDDTRSIDVICMGRVAVDLYAEQIYCALSDAASFRKYLGGCAGNIAVGTARLGLQSMMFSCVGVDEMGKFLKKTLKKEGVHTDLLYESGNHLTGLVLLGVDPPRNFPLIFYRNDCADMQLKSEHINEDYIRKAKALLITGTGLSTEAMQAVTHQAVDKAKKLNTAVIFDLDFRPVLWGLTAKGDGESRFISNDFVTQQYQKILAKCDLIVGTEEEIQIASGKQSLTDAIKIIRQFTEAPVVVKMGEKGCEVYITKNNEIIISKPFPVEVLNVLGAGDAFMSGLLRGLLCEKSWEKALQYANACGALVVTRHGCAPAMPGFDEMHYFIEHYPNDAKVWKSPTLIKMHEQISDEKDSREHSHEDARALATLEKNKLIIPFPNGFPDGWSTILKMDEAHGTGMNFFCLKMRMNESRDLMSHLESAHLLMTGKVIFNYLNQSQMVERTGYFEEDPVVLHCPAHTKASVHALTDCELLVIQTENDKQFEPLLFNKNNLLESDHRGKGLLHDSSYRIVRTVFDKRNRPESNLVVGEIITFQGHWSSYPPHYHPQAEVYHYRFSEPQGFAFAENGENVMKVLHNDTYKIPGGLEHAHCTAPGYALYTLWFIRHLPDNPYSVPTFRSTHEWTRSQTANRRSYGNNF